MGQLKTQLSSTVELSLWIMRWKWKLVGFSEPYGTTGLALSGQTFATPQWQLVLHVNLGRYGPGAHLNGTISFMSTLFRRKKLISSLSACVKCLYCLINFLLNSRFKISPRNDCIGSFLWLYL